VDVDPATEGWNHAAKLLFSGMTRATVGPELPIEPGNPLKAGILHAPMTGARAVTGGLE
jgi:hypothetical protein